jgi:hypothetical protein
MDTDGGEGRRAGGAHGSPEYSPHSDAASGGLTRGAGSVGPPGSPALIAFLQKDYELKIRFLTDHYSRIWTRFNFFVATHTALSVALFGWFKDRGPFSRGALPIAVIGVVVAACWYCFGAQDRYLVAVYREHVLGVARQLARALALDAELGALRLQGADATYVAVGDVALPRVRRTAYQWRADRFSTTKLVAWFPILVTVYWAALLVRILGT